jgi:hypothetical protein
MRVFSEEVYGIPSEQAIGSSGKLKFHESRRASTGQAAGNRLHR